MIYLPRGARSSELIVHPKNWKTKSAPVDVQWRITYRYYPAGGKAVLRKIMGMNRAKDLATRQEITKALLDNELALLRAGLDAVSQQMPEPVDLAEVNATTALSVALQWAEPRLQIVQSTRIDLKHYLGKLLASAGKLGISGQPLAEVRKRDLRAILRNACPMPYQFNKARGYLMSLVEELCDEEAMEANPVRNIKRMKTTKRLREVMSIEDRRRVDAYLREHNYPFWRWMQIFFHSGAREIELGRLRREDVDLAGGRYKCVIKKGRQHIERWRPIKEIAAPLWSEVMQEAAPGQVLFSRGLRPGDAEIRPDQLGKRWRRLVKERLGITASLYSLKHANLTEVSGILGQEAAARLAGHTSTAMVAKYYDVQAEDRELQRIRTVSNSFA
jgi:integrase